MCIWQHPLKAEETNESNQHEYTLHVTNASKFEHNICALDFALTSCSQCSGNLFEIEAHNLQTIKCWLTTVFITLTRN